jgi:hypothetical protein
MLQKAAKENLIRELGEELAEGGVISLQYADDIILFVDKDLELTKNLKWTLTCFELISGMRINFHKSEMVSVNVMEREEVDQFASIFGCPVGLFPL